METETHMIPEWALPYLINNDPSGLSAKEVNMIDEFMEERGLGECFMPDDESPEFRHCPAFGESAMCYECELSKVKEGRKRVHFEKDKEYFQDEDGWFFDHIGHQRWCSIEFVDEPQYGKNVVIFREYLDTGELLEECDKEIEVENINVGPDIGVDRIRTGDFSDENDVEILANAKRID